MPTLENAPRPEDQREAYRFFRDADTGQLFKAMQHARTADNNDPALSISVALVDAEGKAQLDPLGKPDVYWHTHTFTAEELADPEFDMIQRRASILIEAVTGFQVRLRARGQVASIVTDGWGGDDPLPLEPVPVIYAVGGRGAN